MSGHSTSSPSGSEGHTEEIASAVPDHNEEACASVCVCARTVCVHADLKKEIRTPLTSPLKKQKMVATSRP